MTGGEDQAQQVVVERIVDLGGEVGALHLAAHLQLAPQLQGPALVDPGATQPVDRPVLAGGHEPGARVVRDARLRPLLQRGHQRLLRQVLRQPDVAHDPGQPGDQPRGLDPPDGVDRALDVYWFASACLRRRSSCSRNSGVNASPKSSASNTGRTSITSPGANGARLTHSSASSSDFTCHSQ